MKYDQPTNNDRVKQLINTYGANPDSWPADEREAAVALLKNASELQSLLGPAKELDNLLTIDKQTTTLRTEYASVLANKVSTIVKSESATSSRVLPMLRNFLYPRYAIAFSVLLVAILVIYMTPGHQTELNIAQSEFDRWMLAQVTGVTFEEETPVELGFMELVELEVDADLSI